MFIFLYEPNSQLRNEDKERVQPRTWSALSPLMLILQPVQTSSAVEVRYDYIGASEISSSDFLNNKDFAFQVDHSLMISNSSTYSLPFSSKGKLKV